MNRGRYDDAVVVLPCELQVEIPPWLPEKTLLRLRCVCKFWKTLVFDPIFVKLHVEGSRRDTTPRYCSMQRLLDDHPSLMDEVGGHGFDQKCHNMVGVRNGLRNHLVVLEMKMVNHEALRKSVSPHWTSMHAAKGDVKLVVANIQELELVLCNIGGVKLNGIVFLETSHYVQSLVLPYPI
ncbi:hypothetical protein GYH30_035870 [Glycine max]|uniref:F-box domain-containing protein n=2 Tax=Glycine subgen. Soja TaxID=1462606 RepID=K7LZ44_SOYBN|nr:hypothetical protein GYH30_035870 [Glycine max]